MRHNTQLPRENVDVPEAEYSNDLLRRHIPLWLNSRIDSKIGHLGTFSQQQVDEALAATFYDPANPDVSNQKVEAYIYCSNCKNLLAWAEAEIMLPTEREVAIVQAVVAFNVAIFAMHFRNELMHPEASPQVKSIFLPHLYTTEYNASLLYDRAARELTMEEKQAAYDFVIEHLQPDSPLVSVAINSIRGWKARLVHDHPAGTS
jgi:hypothetical protein